MPQFKSLFSKWFLKMYTGKDGAAVSTAVWTKNKERIFDLFSDAVIQNHEGNPAARAELLAEVDDEVEASIQEINAEFGLKQMDAKGIAHARAHIGSVNLGRNLKDKAISNPTTQMLFDLILAGMYDQADALMLGIFDQMSE
jgi:hypothetical protein